MTNEQTLKAKPTNEQYVALLYEISKIYATLDRMSRMVSKIENDRQSKDEDDGCYDLYKIDRAIRFGHQKIVEMEEMIGEVRE